MEDAHTENATGSDTWQWAELRFDKSPEAVYCLRSQFRGDSAAGRKDGTGTDNFLKGVRWYAVSVSYCYEALRIAQS